MKDVRWTRRGTFNLGITEITLVPGADQGKQKQWFGRAWEKQSCRKIQDTGGECLLAQHPGVSPHEEGG